MKKIVIIGLAVTAILTFAGCATPVHQIKTPFNEQDFAPYSKKGTASIVGQAFLKTRGGEVRYGAGNTVALFPSTAYTQEITQNLGFDMPNYNDGWKKYIRKIMADGSGNFEFSEIPAGDYYLETEIFWEVPGKYGLQRTGDVVRKVVKVTEGEKLKVILTQ